MTFPAKSSKQSVGEFDPAIFEAADIPSAIFDESPKGDKSPNSEEMIMTTFQFTDDPEHLPFSKDSTPEKRHSGDMSHLQSALKRVQSIEAQIIRPMSAEPIRQQLQVMHFERQPSFEQLSPDVDGEMGRLQIDTGNEYEQKLDGFYNDHATDRSDVCDLALSRRAYYVRELLFREVIDIRESHSEKTLHHEEIVAVFRGQENDQPEYYLQGLISNETRRKHHWRGKYAWFMTHWLKSPQSETRPNASLLKKAPNTPAFFSPQENHRSRTLRTFKKPFTKDFMRKSRSATDLRSLGDIRASQVHSGLIKQSEGQIWKDEDTPIFYPSLSTKQRSDRMSAIITKPGFWSSPQSNADGRYSVFDQVMSPEMRNIQQKSKSSPASPGTSSVEFTDEGDENSMSEQFF